MRGLAISTCRSRPSFTHFNNLFQTKKVIECCVLCYATRSFRSFTIGNIYKNSKSPLWNSPSCNNTLIEIGLFNCLLIAQIIRRNPVTRILKLMNTVSTSKKCWNCNKEIQHAVIFCNHCNNLQPVDKGIDFFQLLGMTFSYKVEQTLLRNNYRSLQTFLHPDKFSSKSKKEQELSEEFSSVVNKAYSTLLDPLERGLYLLKLKNIYIEESTTSLDKVFLMEVMERNEEIENETDVDKLKEYYTNNEKQLHFLVQALTEAFDANNLQEAKELLTKMKYYKSIREKIKDIKQKLNID